MKSKVIHFPTFAGLSYFLPDFTPDLILVFADRMVLNHQEVYMAIQKQYGNVPIVFSSTAGEIAQTNVSNDSISIALIDLEQSVVKGILLNADNFQSHFALGQSLVEGLIKEGLRHILVFSDGHYVNAAELLKGLNSIMPEGIGVTGALAGDGDRFISAPVGLNNIYGDKNVIAIGLYGEGLTVRYASRGGWDGFGRLRTITRSFGNKLYELDGEPALKVYTHYLGDEANDLPGSALKFPLALLNAKSDKVLVRTLLAIDDDDNSLVFAGDMPEGAAVQLMTSNLPKLINAAKDAGYQSNIVDSEEANQLAIVVSCVGRKIMMGQMTVRELEMFSVAMKGHTDITGLYSYGEICPSNGNTHPDLHNQSFTVTVLAEQ